MTGAHLEASGIKVRFGDFAALDGVDLSVRRGELVTLLGPSGCGKTTLLRVIAGFQQQGAGHVTVGGRNLDGIPPEGRNFGMVFQSYAVFPHMSVADNVAYGLTARGVRGADRARRVQAALERVQLGALAARYPEALSGGQKQRVGLARAMVIEPDLLLMDEPLSNLDALLRIEMRREIRLMQRELGITTIYVTHDQEEALAISDRIAVMRQGRLLQIAPPEEVFEAPAHAFVADFIGGCNWFDATLTPGEAGDAVALAEGPRFVLPHGKDRPAGPVRVALRNEDLRLCDAPGALPCLSGQVLMRAYMGHRTRLHLRLASGATLDADVPSGAGLPAEGAGVHLEFHPSRARLFTREAGPVDGWRIA
jgi:ABC-type Fe3+/spermidine/putrescine transport system ATPase subunit